MTATNADYDVVIVGGGPAGLGAALWLARYQRRVRVFDRGSPRNEPTWAVHGYPGLPDLPPSELRSRLRDRALGAGAEHTAGSITRLEGEKDAFRIHCDDGAAASTRRLLLAFGRRDILPDIPGIEAGYGTSVFHCPDCDGPSIAGSRVGVIGWDRHAAALALFLRTWTDDLVLLAHGHTPSLEDDAHATLARYDIPVRTETITRLRQANHGLTSVELEGGRALPLDALFFHLGSVPAADLADPFDCDRGPDGSIQSDRSQETSVAGLYAAGDITGHPHLVISAAAEGVRAALAIHRSLLPSDHQL